MQSPVHLVETTLRDGSYEIDFQFTAEDTAFIAGALDRAGFSYIELCHGNGIGCHLWAPQHLPAIRAAASDEEHLAAAHAVVERAQYGVFMMAGPEFAPIEHLAILPKHGARFVRYGVRPDQFHEELWWPYVTRAKELGLLVAVNLMQACALDAKVVAEGSKQAAKLGADWFYIVDSAGEMNPNQTREYIRAIRDASDMRIGLHAHNNSGLATANSLAALEAGATLVDGTLQGMGRATGNPTTEHLVLALQKLGHETGIEREAVLALGDLSRSLFAERGNDPTFFCSGAAGVHSRALPNLRKVAKDAGISLRELIMGAGAEIAKHRSSTRDKFPAAQLEAIVRATPPVYAPTPPPRVIDVISDRIARLSADDPAMLCTDLYESSFKRRKTPVLHLVPRADFPFPSAIPWESGELIGMSLPVSAETRFDAIAADRQPEILVLDDTLAPPQGLKAKKHTLRVSFRGLAADAAADLVVTLTQRAGGPVWFPWRNGATEKLIQTRLLERGIALEETLPTASPRVIVIGASRLEEVTGKLAAGDTVVLLDRADGMPARVDAARARGAKVVHPMYAAELAGRITALVAVADRVARAPQPAGGLVDPFVAAGSREVVVDDPQVPSQIVDPVSRSIRDAVGAVALVRGRALLGGRGRL